MKCEHAMTPFSSHHTRVQPAVTRRTVLPSRKAFRQTPCAVSAMGKYSKEAEASKSCKSRGYDLRVHFKVRTATGFGGSTSRPEALTLAPGPPAQNTRETAAAIKGMKLTAAKKYLEAVVNHERCIPFRRFCGGVGRTAQAKNENSSTGQGRWPVKSVKILQDLLRNAESNAEVRAVG
jgi:large subunit ribosomal protein L17e